MREFSFRFAIIIALLMHAILGFVLKFNPLVAAAPIVAPQKPAPVTMRFVEVPPESKTIQETPRTNNLSDANRKAGPLEKTPETTAPRRMSAPPTPGPRASRSPGPAAAKPVEKSETISELPEIQAPQQLNTPASKEGDQPEVVLPGKKLAQSLRNLDQYIGPGTSGEGSGGGGEGGDLAGDPGSGVYFDTRGFDLGPWGNRVVAIVKSNWLIPVAAQLGVKGVVSIAFQVDKSGTILDPRITASSNVPSFDQAALNALKTSNPFPPLPADFPRPTLAAVFRFYYNLPVPN